MRVFSATTGRATLQRQPKLLQEGSLVDYHALTASPDGRRLAIPLDRLVVFGVGSGATRSLSDDTRYADAVAWSPDGATIAATYEVTSWYRVSEDEGVAQMQFAMDKPTRAAAIDLVDVATGRLTRFEGPQRGSGALAWCPDGRCLVVGTIPGVVHVYDATTRTLRCRLEGDGSEVTAVAFSPDGALLAAGAESGAILVYPFDACH